MAITITPIPTTWHFLFGSFSFSCFRFTPLGFGCSLRLFGSVPCCESEWKSYYHPKKKEPKRSIAAHQRPMRRTLFPVPCRTTRTKKETWSFKGLVTTFRLFRNIWVRWCLLSFWIILSRGKSCYIDVSRSGDRNRLTTTQTPLWQASSPVVLLRTLREVVLDTFLSAGCLPAELLMTTANWNRSFWTHQRRRWHTEQTPSKKSNEIIWHISWRAVGTRQETMRKTITHLVAAREMNSGLSFRATHVLFLMFVIAPPKVAIMSAAGVSRLFNMLLSNIPDNAYLRIITDKSVWWFTSKNHFCLQRAR